MNSKTVHDKGGECLGEGLQSCDAHWELQNKHGMSTFRHLNDLMFEFIMERIWLTGGRMGMINEMVSCNVDHRSGTRWYPSTSLEERAWSGMIVAWQGTRSSSGQKQEKLSWGAGSDEEETKESLGDKKKTWKAIGTWTTVTRQEWWWMWHSCSKRSANQKKLRKDINTGSESN